MTKLIITHALLLLAPLAVMLAFVIQPALGLAALVATGGVAAAYFLFQKKKQAQRDLTGKDRSSKT